MQSHEHKMLWLATQVTIKEYKIDGLNNIKSQIDVTLTRANIEDCILRKNAMFILHNRLWFWNDRMFRTELLNSNKGLDQNGFVRLTETAFDYCIIYRGLCVCNFITNHLYWLQKEFMVILNLHQLLNAA